MKECRRGEVVEDPHPHHGACDWHWSGSARVQADGAAAAPNQGSDATAAVAQAPRDR